MAGLYAAGAAAAFGGGGIHGYRALEGTLLGGSIFSGRAGDGRGRWITRPTGTVMLGLDPSIS